MPSRITTAIFLLLVLFTGMVTPGGACALMCARHHEEMSLNHCGQKAEVMPPMAHGDHSTMNQSDVEVVSPALMSQSCYVNCAAAERLAVSRKIVLQVTPVQSGAVALDTTPKFLALRLARSGRLDGTPPELLSSWAPAFSVLRI